MPTQKDFKRLVRGRMRKTGESYTAARAQLLKSTSRAQPALESPPGSTPPAGHAKLAGMSDAAVRAATGRTWAQWATALDRVDAHTWPHRKIADYVHEEYGVPGWWTQTVTVGYERIRGLREIGQRRGGGYEATKSRTFASPVAALYAAFTRARTRARWLPGVKLTMRKATPDRSVRITWQDGSSVEVWLTAKGAGKSTAQIQHRKLPDKEAANRMKSYWAERLDALEKALTSQSP